MDKLNELYKWNKWNKNCRIHRTQQYEQVFSTGRKLVGRYMVMVFRPNQLEISRVGIITSKKVGKAFERNFAKRRLRGLVRENWACIQTGYDLVLIARVGIKSADYEMVIRDFKGLLKKGRLYHAKVLPGAD